MQNRIAEMNLVWQQLNLLKSLRLPRSQPYPGDGLETLPPPPFKGGATPLMPVVGKRALHPLTELFAGKVVLAEADAAACDEHSVSMSAPVHCASTPPMLMADRLATLSSRDVDLPELPPEDAAPTRPASPRGSASTGSAVGSGMKRLRKKMSKRLSAVAIDLSGFAQKMSPRSGRSSPEKSSPARRASPRKDDPLLASLPTAERNRIAVRMAEYCQTDVYASASDSPTRQALLFNGYLIGLLSAFPELVRPEALKALRTDLAERMSHAIVDTVVDLQDPAFSGFVNQVATANFMKPWTHDSADASDPNTGAKKKNADVLRPTFVRDFDNSDYYFRTANGIVEKIGDTDQFIRLIGRGSGGNLSRVVSNIASQNLGNFLKNVLFLRHDADGNSQSVLRLHDGTPVMPLAVAKASYVFSKADDGTLALDYEWKSAAELNSGKPLRVKRMAGDNSVSAVQEAELSIKVKVTIAPDGRWRIGNPSIHAKGWHMPVPS